MRKVHLERAIMYAGKIGKMYARNKIRKNE